jgi:hypothetical protein
MIESFITYKVFADPSLAKDFGEILSLQNISFTIEEDTSNLDSSFANHPLNRDYRLKLKQKDFIAANSALEDFFKKYAETVEEDHYLNDFSDSELMEILIKPDEWGELNYQLAQRILKDRGKEITMENLEAFKKQRLEELSQPEKTDYSSIVFGYVFALVFSPASIFLGYMVAYSKKTLPDGQRVYAYTKTQRFHGEIILIIASLVFLFALIGLFFFR